MLRAGPTLLRWTRPRFLLHRPPTQVKEEERQEAESISAVLEVLGVSEEVADDPVATEEPVETKAESAPLSAELAPGEIAAEAAFSDLDRAKEETAGDPVSSPSEHVAEAETTDLLGLDDTEPDAEGDPAQVEPTPTVADPPGVATEATTADSSDLVPPPTSPNLVEPGTEPVRVGHSPAASSREPRRQRHRGSRGGQTTRWQEALREWWLDFEKVQRWLYNNSGGNIARGFWLDRISLEDVDSDQKWFVCNFHLLQEYLTTSQLLALAYHIWSQYSEWAHNHGLDRRRGVSHGRQVIDSKILPPQSEINLNILGVDIHLTIFGIDTIGIRLLTPSLGQRERPQPLRVARQLQQALISLIIRLRSLLRILRQCNSLNRAGFPRLGVQIIR